MRSSTIKQTITQILLTAITLQSCHTVDIQSDYQPISQKKQNYQQILENYQTSIKNQETKQIFQSNIKEPLYQKLRTIESTDQQDNIANEIIHLFITEPLNCQQIFQEYPNIPANKIIEKIEQKIITKKIEQLPEILNNQKTEKIILDFYKKTQNLEFTKELIETLTANYANENNYQKLNLAIQLADHYHEILAENIQIEHAILSSEPENLISKINQILVNQTFSSDNEPTHQEIAQEISKSLPTDKFISTPEKLIDQYEKILVELYLTTENQELGIQDEISDWTSEKIKSTAQKIKKTKYLLSIINSSP